MGLHVVVTISVHVCMTGRSGRSISSVVYPDQQ